MLRTSCAGLVIVMLSFAAGCAERSEVEKLRAELAEARAEMKALQAQPPAARQSYLDELERLETLKSKGALTDQEFQAKKRAILATPAPTPTTPLPQVKGAWTVEELEKQLREVHGLWNKNALTGLEYNEAKAKLLRQPLRATSLAADLGRVQTLWNQNILTGLEYNDLKQKVLQLDTGK